MEPQQKEINIDLAIKQYKNHLECVKKYQKNNPDKMSIKAKRYYEKLKESNHDKYAAMLEKKRLQYQQKKALKNKII